ncbi:MAG: cytochrome c biogenesis protein CcsA, partial [Bacteroidota bacterium]
RELPENLGLPWTQIEEYLGLPFFQDGRGLNPLLQNYWMVIHPPIVMLGFALTAIPFCYAIAGLARNKLVEWIKPALTWSFAGIMILGGGLLMGGAWAYEALSFGGFWAWDPVENASLVPWLTLVGGAHVMLVNRKNPKSLFSAFFLILSTFILIIYSTFLTRSGVLGDSSVHSFTGDGMIEQLMVFLVAFIALAIGFLIRHTRSRWIYFSLALGLLVFGFVLDKVILFMLIFVISSFIVLIWSYIKYFPKAKEEESLWSREFWLFVGAMVLLMSAGQIIVKTSLPVFNYLSEPLGGFFTWFADTFNSEDARRLATGSLAIESQEAAKMAYNKYQIPFAMFITLFMAFTQFLRYRKTPFKEFRKAILLPFFISIGFFTLFFFIYDWGQYFSKESFGQSFFGLSMVLLLLTSLFTIIGNADYFIRILKGKFDHAGASIAHIGFGMVILGALISTGQSEKISSNSSSQDVAQFNEAFNNSEDLFMFQRDTLLMGDRFVVYSNKFKDGINFVYNVDYYKSQKKNYQTGDIVFNQKTGGFFKAKRSHEASANFLFQFEENWEPVFNLDNIPNNSVRRWAPFEISDKDFALQPQIQLNEKFGNVPEPDTKHYLHKDIYTHVKYGDLQLDTLDEEGYQAPNFHEIAMVDTIKLNRSFITLDSLRLDTNMARLGIKDTSALMINSFVTVHLADTFFLANPQTLLSQSGFESLPDKVDNLGIKVGIEQINWETGKFKVSTALHDSVNPDFIIMQAIVFPLINILWLGSILMVLGTLMAIRYRLKRERK